MCANVVLRGMDTIPTEERRLYEISYTSQGAEEEEKNVQRDLRDIVEKQGGMVQDAQSQKKYRGFSRGFMHIIAAPSLVERIEAAIRAFSSPILKRVLLVRWEKTAPHLRGHAFMRKPSIKQEERGEGEERRADEIDKQIDELLEKQL